MEVWHVRHGERCDEVSGAERSAWNASDVYRSGGYYDSPLTKHGHVQASRAGLYLKDLPFNQGLEKDQSGFDRVYTSPLRRAVQTAVCISQALGNIPLQVVPGLCSCTAGLRRIGYSHATLMSDAHIADTFPEANLLPRDPLAPTSFEGAQAWLAARPNHRVLAVGHREGTKAMAGAHIPTPHCCIGIFKIDPANKPYELHDLLSRAGRPLGPERSSYAVPPEAKKKLKNGSGNVAAGAEAIAARVIAFTVAANIASNRIPAGKPARERRSDSETGEPGLQEREDDGGVQQASGGKTKRRSLFVSPLLRMMGSGKGKTNGGGSPSPAAPAPVPARSGRAPRATGGGQMAPPLRSERVRSAACTAAEEGGNTDVGRADRDPSTPGACAGRGFRVAALSRRSVKGVASFAGFLGVPVETLCGPSGVLSFLRATELGRAQATCKAVATAAVNKHLWIELYSRLPKRLKDRTESSLATGQSEVFGAGDPGAHPKVLFVRALSIASSTQARRVARDIAVVRRRLTVFHGLRPAVETMKAGLSVRLNGEPTDVVDSRGTRTEAWVSRAGLCSEPSVHRGLRSFLLSSSVKVRVPSWLESPQLLRSMCVSLSLPDSWLPREAVLRIDQPLLSQERLLGRSADGGVALYDIAKSCCRRARNSGDGAYPPAPRASVLLGVLDGGDKDGRNNAGGVAFLTAHFPHELQIDVGTRRRPTAAETSPPGGARSRSYGDDSVGPLHGLEDFAVALGLRTAGVPLWEKTSTGVLGRLGPRSATAPPRLPSELVEDIPVVCLDLVNPRVNSGGGASEATALPHAERTLGAGPGLPYSTFGGLSGVVEDVLLAEFGLYDSDGASLWAFASPVVFEASPAGWADAEGGDSEDDHAIDLAHRELREERRRGYVEEIGVGRVVVELALVESSDEGDDELPRTAAQRRCPAGHAWVVRTARVELELSFVDAWFGTKHGV